MDDYKELNEILVRLFRSIMDVEEKAIITREFQDITNNDMHVIEAIGIGTPKNMSSIAKKLSVTVGTLTIAMNSLVKKGYVKRERGAELLQGDRLAGLQYTNLSAAKPIILVIGGSLGSVKVNGAVRSILPKLLEQFQVIHICGKGNLDESLIGTPGYVQYEYVDSPLKHLFAAADLIVSRAGANSICEILALRKPNVLIPLSAAASRGDQILNANSFAKQGYSTVLEEEKVTDATLFDAIHDTYENRRTFIDSMEKSHLNNAIDTIMKLINDCADHK